jgi:hypothetical protein
MPGKNFRTGVSVKSDSGFRFSDGTKSPYEKILTILFAKKYD